MGVYGFDCSHSQWSRQRSADGTALFSHDLPVEQLGENFQYHLG